MNPNAVLWQAIKTKWGNQRAFARALGVDQSEVSRVVNGSWILQEDKKIRYAEALGISVNILFPL